VFAARPANASGRPEFVEGRKTGDLSIRDQSTPP